MSKSPDQTSEQSGKHAVRSQTFPLRLISAMVLLFTALGVYYQPEQTVLDVLYEKTLGGFQDYLSAEFFTYAYATACAMLAAWLLWGHGLRSAGLLLMIVGGGALWTLAQAEDAWSYYPFFLNTDTGTLLLKDVLYLGIGFFLLVEKRK